MSFPFLRTMAEEGSAHAIHMKGARFPTEERGTNGNHCGYMLSKIATAGQSHAEPHHGADGRDDGTTSKEVICNPACGTCGSAHRSMNMMLYGAESVRHAARSGEQSSLLPRQEKRSVGGHRV